MKQKKLKSYPTFESNPFLQNLKLKKGRRAISISPARHMVDEDGTITETQARMVVNTAIDKSHFGKVFFENIPIEKIDGVAMILLIFLLKKVGYNETTVYFDPKEWLDEDKTENPKFSVKTIYKAIKNLLDLGMIARKGSGFYFINPSVGFKGNRLELLK